MLTFESAKELKDAGFPQAGEGKILLPGIDSPIEVLTEIMAHRELSSSAVYVPTLSELVEACGGNFYILAREKHEIWAAQDHGHFGRTISEGTTPEEAVARLWLALNKK